MLRRLLLLSWLAINLYALLGYVGLTLQNSRWMRGNYFIDETIAFGNVLILTVLLTCLRRGSQRLSPSSLSLGSALILVLYLVGSGCYLGCRLGGGSLAACQGNLKNLATGLEMYASDHHGGYPHSLQEVANESYLKKVPTCPAAGKDTYSAKYEIAHQPERFTLVCGGCHHHQAELDEPDYPRYLSEEGLIGRPESVSKLQAASSAPVRRAPDGRRWR